MRSRPFLLALAAWATAGCAVTRVSDVEELGRRGSNPELRAIWVETNQDGIRVAVIGALAEHPDEQGLILTAREAGAARSQEVRVAAVRALARYQGSPAIKALLGALGDPWPEVRAQAAASLAAHGSTADRALLEAASSASSPLVRAAATKLATDAALARAEIRPPLQATLQDLARRDPSASVRAEAVAALGRLAVAESRPLLVELRRTDEDPSVRVAAERALEQLGDRGEPSTVVLVLPLKNSTGQNDAELVRLTDQIADFVAARLSAAKVCQVVEPARMERAIAELTKHGHALYDGDAPNAPEIGRFKIANQLVYGSLQREGQVYTILLQRMDVATLQLVPGASATVSGYRADLDRLKVEVTERFLANFR